MGQNNAKLTDPSMLIQAGIDPKTGLPIKVVSADKGALKANIKKLLRVVDQEDAIRRYKWYNLPAGLNQELLERILYYRGAAAFFFMKENQQFYFLPFALDGTIDVYGRYTGITPVPFNGTSNDGGKKDTPWIQGLHKTPIYEFPIEINLDMFENGCVILSDYCRQYSQTIIPRQQLQDPLLEVMSDCIPFMRTALLNSTGVQGMRVNGQDEYSNVLAANASIDRAAVVGEKYVPIVGGIDFQNLTDGATGKTEEFMLAMQSLDNFRLSLYGLDNGGLFEKKQQILESENAMNADKASRTYQDGLTLRQDFCDTVNSIWGLSIWCEPSESAMGDFNGDYKGFDDQDQSGAQEGVQESTTNTEVEE